MKLSKYAGITAVLGCAFAYGIVGCGGGSTADDDGGSGGKGGSKTGGKGGSSSGGKGGSSTSGGKGGSSTGGSGGSSGGSTTGGAGGGSTGGSGGGSVTGGSGGSEIIGDPPAVLQGHWSMDDNLMDKTANNNTGTSVKGGQPTAPAEAAVFVEGKKGKAIKFVNPDQTETPAWVKVPRSDSIDKTGTENGGMVSISAWVNPNSLNAMGDFNWVLSRQEGTTSFEHFGLGTFEGKPTAGVHFFFVSTTEVLPTNMWSHLALTYNGITLTVYVNGAAGASQDIGWPIGPDTTDVVIGANANEGGVKESWDGLLDEVKLYSGVLTAQQIMDEAK